MTGLRRVDLILKYSNDKDCYILDITPEEEAELIKLREREEPRVLKNTEELYWAIVSKEFGKIVEEYEGVGREAEYIDVLVRFYDPGGKNIIEEEYDIYS